MRFDDEAKAAKGVQDADPSETGTSKRMTTPTEVALSLQGAAAGGAMRVVPGPDGVVTLPPGVDLDDIRVVGRDLVVTLPDGTQWVIVDGAIVVPQLVLDNVQVPPANLAALLIGQEVQPAAGPLAAGPSQSSGGNFSVPVGDIGDPFALGDLLPPTDLAFTQPVREEVIPGFPEDEDPGVIIITPDNPAGAVMATVTVNEAGLPARGSEPPGSNAAASSETASGTIEITSGDAPFAVAINGVAITAVGQTFTSPSGTLTITSIGPTAIGFSYTLTDNLLNGSQDSFAVTITDADGDTASGAVMINVVDDVPTARADTDTVAAGEAGTGGNVLTGADTTSGAAGADTPGADGAALNGVRAGTSGAFTAVGGAGATIAGQFGTLTIGANGTYTYTKNAGVPGGSTDVFTYQIVDGDGDTSTATLTITNADSGVTLSVPSTGPGTIVDEAGLPARGSEPPGSDSASNSESTSGTITYTAPDGPATVTVNGTAVTAVGQVIQVPGGTLTVTSIAPGAIGYTYTLADNAAADPASVAIPVAVTDSDGDTAAATLTITIVDDVPTARNDSAAPAEDTAVVIDVFANDTPGADGVNLATGVALGTAPTKGTVVYNGDGTFTYTPTAGAEGADSFTYTITDGDGDTSTATVDIVLATDSTPSIDVGADNEVDEAGLPAGSDAAAQSETASGTFAVNTGSDTVASLVINGTDVTAGGTVAGAFGTLTVTLNAGVYAYSYTLTTNTSGDNTADTFDVVVTDSDGDAANDTLTIDIIDDVPTARDDADSVTEDTDLTASGTLLANDTQGADGAIVTTVVGQNPGAGSGTASAGGTAIAGQYGTLTVFADGSYSYALNNANTAVQGLSAGETLIETFTYTLVDGDTDADPADLVITINGTNDGVTVTGLDALGSEEVVNEDDLADGSSPNVGALTQAGSFDILTPDGLNNVTVGGTQVVAGGVFTAGLTASSPFGTVTITGFTPILGADGSVIGGTFTYSYTLTDNTLTHPAAGEDSVLDSYAVVVTDADGSTGNASLDIEVIDDVPTAVDDAAGLTEGGPISVTFDVDTNDTPGADATGSRSFTSLTGTYGTITLNGDGTQTYTLNAAGQAAIAGLAPGATLTDTFTYTLVDGDGDSDPATLVVTLTGADDGVTITGLTPAASGGDVTVDEDDLPGGSDATPEPLTQGGAFFISAPDGLDDLTVGGQAVITNGVFTATSFTTGFGNTLTITGYNAATGEVTYTYALAAAQTHAAGGGENSLFEDFAVVLTDTDGSTANDTLSVNIVDDVPLAVDDVDSVTEDTDLTAAGNLLGNDTQGADGAIVTTVVGQNPGAGSGTASAGGAAIVGQYGTLTVFADGSYSYALSNGNAAVQALTTGQTLAETFTYTLRDADSDSDPANLVITINGTNDVPTVTVPAAGGPGTSVSETGLPARAGEPVGSASATNSETTSGSFSYTNGDGASTVTVNGVTVTVGAVIAGDYGSLTITSIVGTTVNYSYTLADNVDHDTDLTPFESFTVNVADTDGNLADDASATFQINIVDDAPAANPDTDSVTEDTALTADGNVITGVGGGTADVQGADGVSVTGVAAGTPASASGNVGSGVAGTYGSITIGANGAYVYTLNNGNAAVQALTTGQTLTDTFTYTVTDNDGDPSTTTVTITINGTNDVPTVTVPAAGGPGTSVSEAGLPARAGEPAGSASAGSSETTTGSFSYTNGDGASTVTVNGVTVAVGAVIAGDYGSLTITSIVGTTVNYSYTLADNVDHDTDLTPFESFTVNVADTDGNLADDASATFQINIVDDAPAANPDTDSVTEDTALTADGNVITGVGGGTADVQGADGVSVTGVAAGTPASASGNVGSGVAGTYGSITIGANGAYVYTLNNGNAAVQALTTGQTLTDTFTYTVTDNDGDPSTTTVTITINGTNDVPTVTVPAAGGPGTSVSEAGLPARAGEPAGSASAGSSETTTGSFSYTNGDGASTVTVNGVTVAVGAVIAGDYGSLTITSIVGTTVNYSYTLADNVDHDTDLTPFESFTVNVADTDGNLADDASATFQINIVDDAPTANADADSVTEDGPLTADGNVLTGSGGSDSNGTDGVVDTQGADGASVTGVVFGAAGSASGNLGVPVAGAYGSLTLNADGSYSYTLNNTLGAVQGLDTGETLTETFTYTITDNDGDPSTTTLTITINGANDAPTVTNNAVWMSSDPVQQTASTPTFADGYPLNVILPTDVDGDALTVTASNAPTGVFYFNGITYVALTAGTVLFDTNGGINLLDDLVYRPTATANDTVDVTLNLNVSDGTATVNQSVFIHEVAPTRLPGQNVQIGDGSSPLTSGNDQVQSFTLNADFATGLQGNLDIAKLEVFTDFQQTPVVVPIPVGERDPTTFGANNAGSAREREVQVEVRIGANRFVVVDDDTTAGTFEQSWFYDPATGLMKASVSYTDIFLLDGSGNPTATTLADYLTANPPQGGDSWTVTYFDNNGGNYQARLVRFEFKYDDAGNPAITVNGDPVLSDTIYGTSGDDTLNGNGGNDIIYGRGGDDVINGGDGDDTLFGNDGNDTITGGPGTDTIDGGSGTNTITPPVVLDLDGDGLEFVDTSAGVRFDFDGDGAAEATAWTAPDDGLLVYDVNGDRQVSGAAELVLTGYADGATTDLDALRLAFDTNGDGQFTAADAKFASFGVWQDANGNGVTDAGEFHTLAELGITGINLSSDGRAYTAAGGEVHVAGQTTFTRADGSQGIAGDASFATVSRQTEEARAAQSANTQVLASAIAAAGVAAVMPEPASAQSATDSPAASTDPVSVSTGSATLSGPQPEVGKPESVDTSDTKYVDPAAAADARANGTDPAPDAHLDPANDVQADHAPVSDAEAADAGPAVADSAAHADIGAFVEAAALPVIPEGLRAAVDAAAPAEGRLAAVLETALQGPAQHGPDIDALLATLPAGSGPADSAVGGGAHFAAAEVVVPIEWQAPAIHAMPDMSAAAHDAVMATAHA